MGCYEDEHKAFGIQFFNQRVLRVIYWHIQPGLRKRSDLSQYAGLAATWGLMIGGVPPIEHFVQLDVGVAEAVYDPDKRIHVDKHDFTDDGKKRCVLRDIIA